jgi:GNAT superfamily N-acetyltransferase
MHSRPLSGHETPLARILAHDAAYWTTIAEIEQRDGWKLFHNRALLPRIDPNHAGDFRGSEGTASAIVEEIVAFYTALGAPPVAYVDCLATPGDLPVELLAAGFIEWPGASSDLLIYVGPDEAPSATVQVEVVTTAAHREAWAAIVEEEADQAARAVLRRLYLREIADPRITAYLAWVDGRAVSRSELFSSDGLGRVEAVRTLEPYRGRGLAASLVRAATRDSLRRNQLTYIYAEPGGNAKRLYERLGFRTVATDVIRGFLR